jgi:MFS family permease
LIALFLFLQKKTMSDQKSRCCLSKIVDLDLLKAKMAYFFQIGSQGSINPIMSLWMRTRGLTTSQTGVLMSTRPFISFVALPIAGVLADRLKIHRLLLVGCCILSVVLRLFMISQPWLIWIAAFFMACELVGSPVGPLLDSGVLELLGPERREQYGKQRVWGSISFGLTAFLIGAVVSHFGGNYNIYFWAGSVMAIISGIVFFFLPSASNSAPPTPIWKSFGVIFDNMHAFVFFLIMTMIGVATGILNAFLLVVLDEEFHASQLNMGLATAVACMAELPFLFFSKYLLRWMGERNMIYFACVGGILRFLWYTFMKNPWMVLIGELMHGPFFGALWSAAMSYIYHITPPGSGASAQGMLAGLYSGLGNGAGAFIGGILYQNFGYVILFRATAAWLLLALLIFICANVFLPPISPKDTIIVVDTCEDLCIESSDESCETSSTSDDSVEESTTKVVYDLI